MDRPVVSIHALTWRATSPLPCISDELYSFNPRPHMEGDFFGMAVGQHTKSFNPRPHMEGDPALLIIRQERTSFNPRPHMEGDC